jgi:hypothetical protein
MLKRVTTVASLLVLICASLPAGAAVIERDITVAPDRIRLSVQNGVADIKISGGSRQLQAGRPDLPMMSERVVLPAGMKVAGVEVVSMQSEPLSGAVRVPPAFRMRPGILVPDRSEEDPAFYRHAGMQPEAPVALGYQGTQRGINVAFLQVSPVRWDAVSGRLERLSRMRVRLTLEPDTRTDVVKRERIVREWEKELSGIPTRDAAATITSMAPAGRGAQPFKPTQVPSVLGSPVEYLIVTTDPYVSEFQRLADWKTESGTPAVVRTLSFIRQEYPYGVDDADRVRQFIRDAYARWGTKWVLLGGDTEVIPTRFAYTTFYNGESIACDMYFSCLDGNWNADGDSLYGEAPPNGTNDNCDLLPEVYVGRAPISTMNQVTTFVNKALQYEKTPAGDYENRVLFFAEVLFPQDWEVVGGTPSLDGAQIVEEDCLQHLHHDPNIKYARLYQNYLDSRWEPGALQETRQRVIDSLNVGYNVANHTGHGYRNVMSVGDASLTNGDAAALTNGNRLMNLYAANCTSNAIDFPCIGEAFMHAENGGAVSNVGSSRFDFPVVGRDYQSKHFQLLYVDSIQSVGELEAEQKVPFVAFSTQDYVHRWTQFTLLLLGDPELKIYTGKPRTLTVTHNPSMPLNDTTYSVNVKIGGQPLKDARVTLYKAGDVFRSVVTNGAGNAVLDFRPDSTGTAKLTVTGYDCRPYQTNVTIGASGVAVLVESTPQIDDDNLGGSSGNDDGKFDAGETIDLRVAVRNTGGGSAPSVTGTLSTTDGQVTILTPGTSYGSIAPGAVANGGNYRLSLPYTATDQREIPLRLDLVDGNGRHFAETFSLTSLSPEPRHLRHVVTEISGGDFDGRPETGETVDYSVVLRNLGTGIEPALTAVLRNYDGNAAITDSTASFAVNAPGGEVTGDPFRFTVNAPGALFELRVSSDDGLVATHTFDLTWPANLTGLALVGGSNYISLTWNHSTVPDLAGYNIYRALALAGPYTRINKVPTDRTGYYRDEGLTPLTRYYFRVSAVDSSGNESGLSAIANETTTPPNHGFFPVLMGGQTPGSVALARIYQPGQMDIVAGANITYLWHSDGSAPVDADGDIVNTQGDFSLEGAYFAAGPSVADLDGGGMEIIAPTWTSQGVYVFDTAGNLKPGWPFIAPTPIWSNVAIGDLNNDGSKELVFGSNGNFLYALRANGTEWINGDNNGSTNGVFKNLGVANNFSTPALADLNKDGQLDIVYAAYNGVLHAWNANGTNVTGFPFSPGGTMTMSPAIGFLDGVSDTSLDVVFMTCGASHESLYVVSATGQRRPGFPKAVITGNTSKQPSPALADVNNDGFLDIVVASTNGLVFVFDRNGVQNPLFTSARYGPSTAGASESSPVVADMNGDGFPDILIGGEDTQLVGFSGATGQILPGFPIRLGGEVRGAPGLCDCDGDGLTEIVLAGWDQNLYVWDYDFTFNPNGLPAWPQFHHDAMRTGLASGPTLVGTPDEPAALPTRLALHPPAPNPTRSDTRFAWAIPAAHAGQSYDFAIYDLSGRRVKQIAGGQAAAGSFSATWNRRDDAGAQVAGGIYFARFRVGGETIARKLIVMP